MEAHRPAIVGPKSVALIPSSYFPHFGGVEEHTRHVARVLKRRGVDVEVWTPDRGEGLGVQTVDNIRVRYLPTPLPARRLSSLASLTAKAPWVGGRWLGAYRSFRPDLLHVQCFGPNGTYALSLAALSRQPLVVSSHGETFMDDHDVFGQSAFQRNALRKALTNARVVTGCSSWVARDLQDRFGAGEVTVVPNGVDVARVDGHARRSRVSPSRRTVIAAGRLVRKKGFDLLIRAAAVLPPDVRIRIVGEGPERDSLEELARELRMAGRVDFLGRRSAEEVQEMMSQADVVVVPSRIEAFGIVVLEAWASGTPLIATSRGGPADLITDSVDGRLVDPEDTNALTRALLEVLADGEVSSQLANTGLQSVRKYTWERVVDDYQRLYESAAAAATDET